MSRAEVRVAKVISRMRWRSRRPRPYKARLPRRPFALESLEPRLLLAADLSVAVGAGAALDYIVRLDQPSQTLQVVDNPTQTVIASQALSDFGPTNRVLVTGNDQNDHLTVDYTAGGAFAVPVSFDGGTHGAGGDTLRVVGTDNLWDLAGSASGTVGQVSFTGVENLTGGSGADTFHIAAVPPGSVTGGGGHDVLDFTNAGSPVSVVLEDATPEGFSGSGTVTFAEIDRVVGSGALTDALTDQTGVLTALWDLDADPTYSNGTQTLEFTAFEQLTGGSGADTFSVSGAQTATLGGGAGADTFQFSNGAVLTGGSRVGRPRYAGLRGHEHGPAGDADRAGQCGWLCRHRGRAHW